MATVQLAEAPKDLISSVKFAPQGPILLTTSWDSVLRIYDARQDSGSLYGSVQFNAPLLDATWDSTRGNTTAYVAGLEQKVYAVDVEQTRTMPIGRDHEQAIKNVVYHSGTRTVITGSWDKTLQQIDTRAFPAESRQFVNLPGKVFSMDCTLQNLLVVAMSERRVNIYDMRQLGEPQQQRESSLKYPTRTVRCMPGGEVGYATTSIEGRVAVEFFDSSDEVQAQKYAFKCHRIADKSGGVDSYDVVTPVNGLAFHPKFGTFFTGGSDNMVCLWDYKAKKRMKQYGRLPGAVMALDVDQGTGRMVAMGVSDDSYKESPIERGPRSAQSAVFIRYLTENEARGKNDFF